MKKRLIGLILIFSLLIVAVSVLAIHTPTHKTGANATSNKTGNLNVTSNPSGANVFVDGISRGLTPIYITGLSVGKHSVLLTKESFKDYKKTVSISAGRTTKLNAKLVKINQTGGGGGPGPSAPTTKCKESDKGANYFVNGTTCLTGNISVCNSDYCLTNSTLLEYYCKGKEVGKREYKCQKGCKDNACIKR